MVSKLLITEQDGTPKQIVFANHGGEFSPLANNDLRISTDGSNETDVECLFKDLADGAARESAKADLGENRAVEYNVRACIEMQVAPATGTMELYWGPSQSSSAAVGNPGGLSGATGDYSGYSSDLADSVKQLDLIGVVTMTNDAATSIQISEVGVFRAKERYGSLVIKNEATNTICDTGNVNTHVVFDPIIPESQ